MNTIARNYLTSLINHATFYLINCGKEDNAGLQRKRTTESGEEGQREKDANRNSEFMFGVYVCMCGTFLTLSEIY